MKKIIYNKENIYQNELEKLECQNYQTTKYKNLINNYLKTTLYPYQTLSKYIKLLQQNNILTKSLENPVIVYHLTEHQLKELVKNYNSHINKVLQLLNNNIIGYQSIFKLLKIFGCFENENQSQKSVNFLIEKIYNQNLLEVIINIFYDVEIEKYNQEFIEFFIKNYQLLLAYKIEQIKTIYTDFEIIQKTNTSNKGNQKQLKVTIKQIQHYLNIANQEISEDLKELYIFIKQSDIIMQSIEIQKLSLTVNRNAFSKNQNSTDDILGQINNQFNYEWIIKQDYKNLILGKYCSSCAHMNGVGKEIAIASMLLPTTQNLVIKFGKTIIAKSTIFINNQNAIIHSLEITENHFYQQYINQNIKLFLKTYKEAIKQFIIQYNYNNKIKITNIYIEDLKTTISNKYLTGPKINITTINYNALKNTDITLYNQNIPLYETEVTKLKIAKM